jgi:hypothetical protein
MDSFDYMAWRHRLSNPGTAIANIIRFHEGRKIYLQVLFRDGRPSVNIPTDNDYDDQQSIFEQPVTDPLARAKVEALA